MYSYINPDYWQLTIAFCSFVSCCVLLSPFYRLIPSLPPLRESSLTGFVGCLPLRWVFSGAAHCLHLRDSLYLQHRGRHADNFLCKLERYIIRMFSHNFGRRFIFRSSCFFPCDGGLGTRVYRFFYGTRRAVCVVILADEVFTSYRC